MAVVSVSEAARQIGVSDRRIRQLIEAGVLSAERSGHAWLVDEGSLRRISKMRRAPGRRPKRANIWLAACQADLKVRPSSVDRVRISRASGSLRRWLSYRSDADLLGQLRSRSDARRYLYAHPSLLPRMVEDTRLVLSGLWAVRERVVPPSRLDAYVRERDVAAVAEAFALRSSEPSEANVTLRIVEDFPPGWKAATAPELLVAADLLEDPDVRAHDEAHRILEELRLRTGAHA